MRWRTASAVMLVLLPAACGSPPTQYFVLSPVAPDGPLAAAACPHQIVAVERVMLPETLDRQSMVSALGPNRLDISSTIAGPRRSTG